jgi:uncharacterized protein YfaT (DUF1175 family)
MLVNPDIEEKQKRKALWEKGYWVIPEGLDTSNFDFTWRPYVYERPYTHQFGTQWQRTGGPSFVIPESEGIKYHNAQHAIKLPNKTNFVKITNESVKFDYSWHPDDTDPPYIYVFTFKNKYNDEAEHVLEYHTPGSTDKKYLPYYNQIQFEIPHYTIETTLKALIDQYPTEKFWAVPKYLDCTDFDFNWRPNYYDAPYLHQFGTQWNHTGGPCLVVPDYLGIKYQFYQYAIQLPDESVKKYDIETTLEDLIEKHPNEHFWAIPKDIDITDFDFSWLPDKYERPYIHEFGTQWQPTGGPKYIVPNNEGYKYQTVLQARKIIATPQYDIETTLKDLMLEHPNEKFWAIPKGINKQKFDFSWQPHDREEPYLHIFGTQWQSTGGPVFVVPSARGSKFEDSQQAEMLEMKDNYKKVIINEEIDFDYSWHPNDNDPPYIYVFNLEYHYPTKISEPALEYRVLGATDYKYMTFPIVKPKPIEQYVIETTLEDLLEQHPEEMFWALPKNLDVSKFDFTWRPYKYDASYIHEFGTQWQSTGGPMFVVPNFQGIKYQTHQHAIRLATSKEGYVRLIDEDVFFDYSWHPNVNDPAYIYVFKMKYEYHEHRKEYVLEYHVPGAIDRKYMEYPMATTKEVEKYYIETTVEDLIKQHPDEIFWALNRELKYEEFNFYWMPEESKIHYVHVFGNSDSLDLQTYYVNAPKVLEHGIEYNYVDEQEIKIDTNLNMFYIDRGTNEGQFESLCEKYPNLIKTRYLNSWIETIQRCAKRTETNLFWVLSSDVDYTKFNFDYYPSTWQYRMVHVFGTQWSQWGNTYLINKEDFLLQTKHIRLIEHLSSLNFVKNKVAPIAECLYDIVYINYGNNTNTLSDVRKIANDRNLYEVEYDTDYYKTFTKILEVVGTRKEHFVWVCSSICDYSEFDFKYTCDPETVEQLHIFASNKQKYGDTFLVNVNSLREILPTIEHLNDYKILNFNYKQTAKRLPAPKVIVKDDTHCNAINVEYEFPYQIFVTEDNKNLEIIDEEPLSMWDEKSKNILVTTEGGTRIIVPKEAKSYVKKELYDYPYIIKSKKLEKSKPLDIIFFSNGEACAEENFEHLLKVVKGLPNSVVGVKGIQGRVASQHHAAQMSNTPWYFLINSKLKVNENFDFSWQPDRLQIPKHYIFLATNPVNGLEYGHQATVANNKKLTLNTLVKGLDFTLDSEHEVVNINSGTSTFNCSEWDTWRTAFREVIKIKHYASTMNDLDAKYRLQRWLNVADGNFADWCLKGAEEAVKYYESVNGDFEKLKLTYDWEWIDSYYRKLYTN